MTLNAGPPYASYLVLSTEYLLPSTQYAVLWAQGGVPIAAVYSSEQCSSHLRLRLAQTPTPLEPFPRLSEAWGGPQIWIKRDDLTGFGLSGNKIRKLEFHLAAAQEASADVVLTCGGIQSNHCRATALACARLGLHAILFLRTPDGEAPAAATGNHRLGELAGAEIRCVTPDEYADCDALMGAAAAELIDEGRSPWVIPEGASDALGMWGMALAFQEMIDQATVIDGNVAEIWHTASSAGTTAGFGWAADRAGYGGSWSGSFDW